MSVELEIRSDTSQAEQGLQRLNRKLANIDKSTGKMSKSVDKLSKSFKRLAVALPLGIIGAQAVKVASQFESLEKRLLVLTGTASKAAQSMKSIEEAMRKTPYSMRALGNAYAQLYPLVQDVDTILLSVSDTVAAIGGGDVEFDRIATALSRIAGAGRVTAERLNQLEDNGVPLTILADTMGHTTAQLRELSSQGELTGKELIAAFNKMAKENFGGAAVGSVNTLKGALSNLNEAFGNVAKNAILKSGFSKIMVSGINKITEAVDKLADGIEYRGSLAVFKFRRILLQMRIAIYEFQQNPFSVLDIFKGSSEKEANDKVVKPVSSMLKELTFTILYGYNEALDSAEKGVLRLADLLQAGIVGTVNFFPNHKEYFSFDPDINPLLAKIRKFKDRFVRQTEDVREEINYSIDHTFETLKTMGKRVARIVPDTIKLIPDNFFEANLDTNPILQTLDKGFMLLIKGIVGLGKELSWATDYAFILSSEALEGVEKFGSMAYKSFKTAVVAIGNGLAGIAGYFKDKVKLIPDDYFAIDFDVNPILKFLREFAKNIVTRMLDIGKLVWKAAKTVVGDLVNVGRWLSTNIKAALGIASFTDLFAIDYDVNPIVRGIVDAGIRIVVAFRETFKAFKYVFADVGKLIRDGIAVAFPVILNTFQDLALKIIAGAARAIQEIIVFIANPIKYSKYIVEQIKGIGKTLKTSFLGVFDGLVSDFRNLKDRVGKEWDAFNDQGDIEPPGLDFSSTEAAAKSAEVIMVELSRSLSNLEWDAPNISATFGKSFEEAKQTLKKGSKDIKQTIKKSILGALGPAVDLDPLTDANVNFDFGNEQIVARLQEALGAEDTEENAKTLVQRIKDSITTAVDGLTGFAGSVKTKITGAAKGLKDSFSSFGTTLWDNTLGAVFRLFKGEAEEEPKEVDKALKDTRTTVERWIDDFAKTDFGIELGNLIDWDTFAEEAQATLDYAFDKFVKTVRIKMDSMVDAIKAAFVAVKDLITGFTIDPGEILSEGVVKQLQDRFRKAFDIFQKGSIEDQARDGVLGQYKQNMQFLEDQEAGLNPVHPKVKEREGEGSSTIGAVLFGQGQKIATAVDEFVAGFREDLSKAGKIIKKEFSNAGRVDEEGNVEGIFTTMFDTVVALWEEFGFTMSDIFENIKAAFSSFAEYFNIVDRSASLLDKAQKKILQLLGIESKPEKISTETERYDPNSLADKLIAAFKGDTEKGKVPLDKQLIKISNDNPNIEQILERSRELQEEQGGFLRGIFSIVTGSGNAGAAIGEASSSLFPVAERADAAEAFGSSQAVQKLFAGQEALLKQVVAGIADRSGSITSTDTLENVYNLDELSDKEVVKTVGDILNRLVAIEEVEKSQASEEKGFWDQLTEATEENTKTFREKLRDYYTGPDAGILSAAFAKALDESIGGLDKAGDKIVKAIEDIRGAIVGAIKNLGFVIGGYLGFKGAAKVQGGLDKFEEGRAKAAKERRDQAKVLARRKPGKFTTDTAEEVEEKYRKALAKLKPSDPDFAVKQSQLKSDRQLGLKKVTATQGEIGSGGLYGILDKVDKRADDLGTESRIKAFKSLASERTSDLAGKIDTKATELRRKGAVRTAAGGGTSVIGGFQQALGAATKGLGEWTAALSKGKAGIVAEAGRKAAQKTGTGAIAGGAIAIGRITQIFTYGITQAIRNIKGGDLVLRLFSGIGTVLKGLLTKVMPGIFTAIFSKLGPMVIGFLFPPSLLLQGVMFFLSTFGSQLYDAVFGGDKLEAAVRNFGRALPTMLASFAVLLGAALINVFKGIFAIGGLIDDLFIGIAEGFVFLIKKGLEALVSPLTKLIEGAKEAFGKAKDKFNDDNYAGVTTRAAGGYVSGPGTSTSDSIPALISDGEYVVNAKSTSKYRDIIEQINAGTYEPVKRAMGGIVSRFSDGGLSTTTPMMGDTEATLQPVPLPVEVINQPEGLLSGILGYAKQNSGEFVGRAVAASLVKVLSGSNPLGIATSISSVLGKFSEDITKFAGSEEGQKAARDFGKDFIIDFRQAMVDITNSVDTVIAAFDLLGEALSGMKDTVVELFGKDIEYAKNKLEGAFDSLAKKFQGFSPAISASGAGGRALPYASGGKVSGPGTSTSDDIPALLSNGEYVINAAATAANYDLVKRINDGNGKKITKLARGGLAGVQRFQEGGQAVKGSSVQLDAIKVELAATDLEDSIKKMGTDLSKLSQRQLVALQSHLVELKSVNRLTAERKEEAKKNKGAENLYNSALKLQEDLVSKITGIAQNGVSNEELGKIIASAGSGSALSEEQIDDVKDALDKLGKRAIEAGDKLQNSFEGFRSDYLPERQAYAEYGKELERLNYLFDAGVIGPREYTEALEKMNYTLEGVIDAENRLIETRSKVAVKDLSNNLSDNLSDALKGGGENPLKQFGMDIAHKIVDISSDSLVEGFMKTSGLEEGLASLFTFQQKGLGGVKDGELEEQGLGGIFGSIIGAPFKKTDEEKATEEKAKRDKYGERATAEYKLGKVLNQRETIGVLESALPAPGQDVDMTKAVREGIEGINKPIPVLIQDATGWGESGAEAPFDNREAPTTLEPGGMINQAPSGIYAPTPMIGSGTVNQNLGLLPDTMFSQPNFMQDPNATGIGSWMQEGAGGDFMSGMGGGEDEEGGPEKNAIQGMKDIFDGIFGDPDKMEEGIGGSIKSFFGNIGNFFSGENTKLGGSLMKGIGGVFSGLIGGVSKGAGFAMKIIKAIMQMLMLAFAGGQSGGASAAISQASQYSMAFGGIVQGNPGQKVPINAHAGEMILNGQQQAQLFKQLNKNDQQTGPQQSTQVYNNFNFKGAPDATFTRQIKTIIQESPHETGSSAGQYNDNNVGLTSRGQD